MRQQPRAGKGLHGAALLVQEPGALESCGEYGSQLLPIREVEDYTGFSIRRWNLFLVDNGKFDAAELESRAIMASQLLQLSELQVAVRPLSGAVGAPAAKGRQPAGHGAELTRSFTTD